MKQNIWLGILLISTFITFGLADGFAQNGAAAQKTLPDSMLTLDKAMQLQYADRPLAERIISDMRQRKLATDYQLDRTEAIILYNNMEFGKALSIYERLLASREAKNSDDVKMDILENLCDTHDALHHTKEKLECINRLLELARRNDNKYYHSVALFLLGKTIYYEGKKDGGIANVRQAIDLMRQADHPNRDHLLHSQMNVLATMLIDNNQLDDALQVMGRNEDILRGQEPVRINDLMTLLAKKANLLVRMDRTAEADSVYTVWKAIPKDLSHPRAYFIIDYLRNRGLYEEAMKVYNQRLSQLRQTGDTVNMMVYIMKWGMAETAYGLHRYQQAADLYLDVVNIGDTLQQQAAASKAQEIEAIYKTHEKEQQIAEQRFWLAVLTAVAILFLIGAAFWGRYSWTVRRKNRAMVQTINELMTYRELAHQIPTPDPSRGEGSAVTSAMNLGQQGNQSPRPSGGAGDGLQFLDIDSKVVRGRLFCNPDFDRDQLVRVSGIDKNRLATIIHQYTGTNIPGYINTRRVEYAVSLMKEYPDYTLVAIAEQCGYTNQTTFIRAFKNAFGMTPSDYRNTQIASPIE